MIAAQLPSDAGFRRVAASAIGVEKTAGRKQMEAVTSMAALSARSGNSLRRRSASIVLPAPPGTYQKKVIRAGGCHFAGAPCITLGRRHQCQGSCCLPGHRIRGPDTPVQNPGPTPGVSALSPGPAGRGRGTPDLGSGKPIFEHMFYTYRRDQVWLPRRCRAHDGSNGRGGKPTDR